MSSDDVFKIRVNYGDSNVIKWYSISELYNPDGVACTATKADSVLPEKKPWAVIPDDNHYSLSFSSRNSRHRTSFHKR